MYEMNATTKTAVRAWAVKASKAIHNYLQLATKNTTTTMWTKWNVAEIADEEERCCHRMMAKRWAKKRWMLREHSGAYTNVHTQWYIHTYTYIHRYPHDLKSHFMRATAAGRRLVAAAGAFSSGAFGTSHTHTHICTWVLMHTSAVMILPRYF